MGLHKILKIVVALIGIAALIVAGMVWANDEAIRAGDSQGLVDTMMTLTWIVVVVAIVLVLIFVVKGLFTGNTKNTLISVGAFALVIAISYFTASGAQEVQMKDGVLSASGSQWVSAGITAFFILAAIAIGLMLVSGAKKLVTK